MFSIRSRPVQRPAFGPRCWTCGRVLMVSEQRSSGQEPACHTCRRAQETEAEVSSLLAAAVDDAAYRSALGRLLAGSRPVVKARTRSGWEDRTAPFTAMRSAGDGRELSGYASIFNSPATIRDAKGDFEEVIKPGAFARSLRERTPVLQWDHGKDPRIGTAPIGDIREVREDDRGLFVRARLYDHPDIERVRLAIAGGSVKGMSFRFGVPDKGDVWTRRPGKPDLREVRDADVHELGPVVFPAYEGTSVTVRAA